MAGFIKRITEHRYRQNIKAMGLMVFEKNLKSFPHCKSIGANNPGVGPSLTPGT